MHLTLVTGKQDLFSRWIKPFQGVTVKPLFLVSPDALRKLEKELTFSRQNHRQEINLLMRSLFDDYVRYNVSDAITIYFEGDNKNTLIQDCNPAMYEVFYLAIAFFLSVKNKVDYLVVPNFCYCEYLILPIIKWLKYQAKACDKKVILYTYSLEVIDAIIKESFEDAQFNFYSLRETDTKNYSLNQIRRLRKSGQEVRF